MQVMHATAVLIKRVGIVVAHHTLQSAMQLEPLLHPVGTLVRLSKCSS